MAVFLFLLGATASLAAPWVGEQQHNGDFPLVRDGQAAAIVYSAEDAKVVSIAAADLAADVERVTGQRPVVRINAIAVDTPSVLVGTLGRSPLIDTLVANGRLDVAVLRGQWESFLITTVGNPLPGGPPMLVIAGSDRRGTAFGVYELSQAIGVSPWYWWADVTPAKKTALSVAAGTRRFGPPSVQYRGIFLNDEDWGLQPWAAKTFEPEVGDIGPKTYAKVCELLLRLKANMLWPGMHPSTKAFNHYPRNKHVADDYAIVMGSSHAEPMLRNNVGEWTAPKEDYNYIANRDGVRKYWEDRVKENGRFENIYTLGMRGIHDSNMQGPKTDAERIATLEQIFADQREILAKHARPEVGRVTAATEASGEGRLPNAPSSAAEDPRRIKDPAFAQGYGGRSNPPDQTEGIPQMFCAYKEVLALYRQGLKVPDDVTIVWPDDNFGYVRNFATAEEQKRSGGFGVYYHISYLGAPLSYLWLSTTPPALIWEEMSKAYDHGARKIWIVNVGDIKPAEIGTELFLQMAWDIKRWNARNVGDVLSEWSAREFKPVISDNPSNPIAGIMAEYYRLNFARRPEHLQWWLRNEPPRPSPLAKAEITARLNAFKRLRQEADSLAAALPADKRAAFEELVGYPVRGAEIANRRYFHGELGEKDQALAADVELKEATRHYNEETAGGKWRGLTSLEPADQQFQSMRVYPWKLPGFTKSDSDKAAGITIEAARFVANRADRNGAGWEEISGLGSVTIIPTTAQSIEATRLTSDAARLGYDVDFPAAGEYTLTNFLLPTHPLVAGRGLRFAVGLDDAPPQLLAYTGRDGSPEWAQGVLNNYVTVNARLSVPTAGNHTLHVYGIDAGVVLDKFTLEPAVRVLPIQAEAWAGSSVNVLANQSNTLLTDGSVQYAAFYAADQHLVLARRALGSEQWEINQTGYTGNVADAHNTVAIAVDGEGYLHVAWDHHANPLNYARGTSPGSLELGPKIPMTGSLENRVTYPMFFRQPDGGLLFLYRDGASGRGNVVLNRYDLRTHQWTQVQSNLISGEGARSAYLAATIDAQGTLHLAWNWRETPDVATNHDLCYAKSSDGGVIWTTSTGAPLALPITAATAEYALIIPQNSRMMNPPSLTADAAGHPFIATYWAPAGTDVPQFHLVRHDGNAWTVTQVTSRTQSFELRGTATKRPPISRASILTRESAAKTQEFSLIYRDDERGGRITAVSCDNLAAPTWRVRELTRDSVGAWEPSIDPAQWSRFGQVHLLVQNVQQQDGNDRQPKPAAPTPISVLSWSPE